MRNKQVGWSIEAQLLQEIGVISERNKETSSNINNITGTISLPTGASTSSKQDTLLASQTIDIKEAPVVAIGVASQSVAVGGTTNRVILTPTVDCWVKIGSNPTAVANTTGNFFMLAGLPSVPITVTPSTTKIAVISNDTQTGYLSIRGIS